MLPEGPDKLIAALVAHLKRDVQHVHGGVSQELLGIFQPDAGQQLRKSLPGRVPDRAGGMLRRIMKGIREAGQRDIGGVILNIPDKTKGSVGIGRMISRKLTAFHVTAQFEKSIIQIRIILRMKKQIINARFADQSRHEEIGQQIIAPENAVKVLPEGRPPDQHVYDHALVIHIQRMRHFGLDQTQITGVQDRFVFAHLMDAVPLQHEKHLEEIVMVRNGWGIAVVLENVNALPSV